MQQEATDVMVPAAPARRQRVDRWFYISVALLLMLFNVVAFVPSILDPSRRNVPLPLTTLVTAHVIVAGAWLLVFLAQATLVATRHIAAHRRLGMIGAVLTLVFVVSGYFTVIEQARRGFDLSGDISRLNPPGVPGDLAAVALLIFFLNFGIVVGAALYYRHRPSVHKRLMLLAVLGGLTPTPVAHVIGHWSALQPWAGVIFPVSFIVFVSLSAIYDRVSQGRIHPVSLWVPILWFVWQAVFAVAIQPSSMWRQFAAWLVR